MGIRSVWNWFTGNTEKNPFESEWQPSWETGEVVNSVKTVEEAARTVDDTVAVEPVIGIGEGAKKVALKKPTRSTKGGVKPAVAKKVASAPVKAKAKAVVKSTKKPVVASPAKKSVIKAPKKVPVKIFVKAKKTSSKK